MQQPRETFDTKDIPLVAYLITCKPGFRIVSAWQGTDSMEKPCTYFSLNNTPSLREEVERYYKGEARVDPREFWGNSKQVRKWTRIYTNGENQRKEDSGHISLNDFYKNM